jgi:alkylhydroperoxidase/carboxymuconolactone decarboxylase family protein YurZ
MNRAEIEAALEAGKITREEAMNMLKNLQRMQKANKMAKGGFPDHNKDNEITQADVLMARGAIPKPTKAAYGGMMKPKKKKMMGGGMASKRNGNMDYRKGGMVYSTKVKKG